MEWSRCVGFYGDWGGGWVCCVGSMTHHFPKFNRQGGHGLVRPLICLLLGAFNFKSRALLGQ